ncbi:hypothetical protein YIM1640_15740 [Thermus oshimai]
MQPKPPLAIPDEEEGSRGHFGKASLAPNVRQAYLPPTQGEEVGPRRVEGHQDPLHRPTPVGQPKEEDNLGPRLLRRRGPGHGGKLGPGHKAEREEAPRESPAPE